MSGLTGRGEEWRGAEWMRTMRIRRDVINTAKIKKKIQDIDKELNKQVAARNCDKNRVARALEYDQRKTKAGQRITLDATVRIASAIGIGNLSFSQVAHSVGLARQGDKSTNMPHPARQHLAPMQYRT